SEPNDRTNRHGPRWRASAKPPTTRSRQSSDGPPQPKSNRQRPGQWPSPVPSGLRAGRTAPAPSLRTRERPQSSRRCSRGSSACAPPLALGSRLSECTHGATRWPDNFGPRSMFVRFASENPAAPDPARRLCAHIGAAARHQVCHLTEEEKMSVQWNESESAERKVARRAPARRSSAASAFFFVAESRRVMSEHEERVHKATLRLARGYEFVAQFHEEGEPPPLM